MIELQTLVDFLQMYGYFAVFGMLLLCGFGLPVPEDISLVAGGVISGLGYANVHLMFGISMAGVLIGDSVMFSLGRFFGQRVLTSRWGNKIIAHNHYPAIHRWFTRYGKGVVFAARFMPGLRSPIFFSAGVTRFVPYTNFILIDGLAALISVPVWVYLGYFGAYNREWLMKWISRSQWGIIGAVVLVIIVLVAITMIKHRIFRFNGNGNNGRVAVKQVTDPGTEG